MNPIDIRPVGEQELMITWEDGHRSLYPYRYLRLNCPCAACCDEWSGRRLITLDKIATSVYPREQETVGRYAIRFKWNDHHETGIYSYGLLRKICPCETCHKDEV